MTNEEALRRLEDADIAVFEAVAGYSSPILDRTMPVLSEAASYSRLWFSIAGLLAVFGGTKGRRTAAEALTALGITSFFANVVLKRATDRRRPVSQVPEERRLPQPSSSSFPSGHSASAAAFSSVVGDEYPVLYIPITGLAGLVAFSRV
jgi:undecaprenyl-diphosphatase